jgi:hypothetical protein
MIKRLTFLLMDVMAFPGLFMGKKKNAQFHLKYLCVKCPESRRKLRDIKRDGKCWWEDNWNSGNYDIPRSFGLKNFLFQYLFLRTDLKKYNLFK